MFYASQTGESMETDIALSTWQLRESDSTDELDQALYRVSKAVQDPQYDKVNSYFKNNKGEGSRYLSLQAILGALVPLLHTEGLHLTMIKGNSPADPTMHRLITRFFHQPSKEFREYARDFRTPDDNYKAAGAFTYEKRLQLASLFNLAGQEDDDGNATAGLTDTPAGYQSFVEIANGLSPKDVLTIYLSQAQPIKDYLWNDVSQRLLKKTVMEEKKRQDKAKKKENQ